MNPQAVYDTILLERYTGERLVHLSSPPTRHELEKLLRLVDVTRTFHRFWPYTCALARATKPDFYYEVFRSIPDFAVGSAGLSDCLEYSLGDYCKRTLDQRLFALFAYDNLRTRYLFGRSVETYVRKLSEHRNDLNEVTVVCAFPIKLLAFVATFEWLLNCHAPDSIMRTLPCIDSKSVISVTRSADNITATEITEEPA